MRVQSSSCCFPRELVSFIRPRWVIILVFANWTVLALEETFLSMCRSSRAIILRFDSKTQWQMFLLLYGRHVCVPKHGVPIQSSINLGDTLLQITRKWKTAETWFLAGLFIYRSSIVSQTVDFFHWMVTIFILITWLVKTKNKVFLPPSCSDQSIQLFTAQFWRHSGVSLLGYMDCFCY